MQVGNETVLGVQGRYFLPLAVFFPAIFVPRRTLLIGASPFINTSLQLNPVLAAYALWVVPRVVIERYWV